ncbi:hypothetical protein AB0M44_44105 [Streptosporangium subroseum]|uniref:hypothetical protein n=1 Tax=Streptosporangium subroseum TaxID=106412 RepID=UPI00342F29E6
MSSDDTPQEQGGHDSGVLALIERIGSVVVPIGVALYAVLYLGVEGMYSVFGITPQQAGIDQSVLLGRLMGTLVLALMVAIPALGLVVGVSWLVNKLTRGAAGRLVGVLRERPWIVALISALWCGAAYWALFYLYGDIQNIAPMVVGAVGLGVLTFLVPFRLLRGRPVGRAGMKVVVGALTGLGLGFVLIIQMVFGAVEVQETGQANEFLGYVGFQDQWTIIKNAEDDKPLYDGRWMMLLGESEGTYIFYDCDKLETFRRPMETTNLGSIQLDPEREKGFKCGDLADDGTAEEQPATTG